MVDPVPWTFASGGDVSERLDWLTDVMQAPTGAEQRRRLRISPRMTLMFDSLESADARRQMETVLVANGAGVWRVPLWQDASRLDSAWVSGSTSNVLNADTVRRRFVVGGYVLLMGQDPRTYDVRQVQAVTDTTVQLTTAPSRTWLAGTWISPLVDARLDAAPSLSRFTGDDAPAQIVFRLTTPLDWSAAAGSASYRNLPVLELLPDGAQDPVFAADRRLDLVDAGTGPVTVYDQPGIPLSLITASFTLVGREEIGAFRSLLYALAGRCSPLWVPTWAEDLMPAAPLVATSTLLDVVWCGVSAWPLRPNRRDLRIELVNGTVLYRRVTSAALAGATTERLVLDSTFGVNASVAEVRRISFLTLARQETDVNLLRYWSHEVVESELRFRGVRANDL